MLPAGLLLLALGFLSYSYGHSLMRLLGLAEDRLELAEGYSPEVMIDKLPDSLSAGCRHWYEVSLRSSFDTPQGYLLQILPKVAVSPTSAASENAEGRDFIGLCEAVEDDLRNPALLNTNLNRALIGFAEGDTGDTAAAVQELKLACHDELEDDDMGPLVYGVWREMTGARSRNPCD